MNEDKFWSNVSKSEGGCWEWTGFKINKGYGRFYTGTKYGKQLAHRVSYEIANGKIPAGMHILHSCDNPACVNPSHLSAGTHKDNMVDCATKGRSGGMKLADASVINLLKDYIAGVSHAEIAAKYNISIRSVPDYTSGKSRAWLHGKHGCPSLSELKAARNTKPGAIITKEIALEIRERLSKGEYGKDLAIEYGIHKATVSDIKLRKIWRDI